jgi:hypothetical protein
MSSRALVVLVSIVFASLSCTDNNVTEVKSPTGPSAAPKASANTAAPFVITAATSSICRVMVKAHDDAKTAADASPEDAELKTLADELQEAVDDVCK